MTDPTTAARRPRVLIPITISFAVRYVVRTGLLARLMEGCDPVLGLSWDDPALEADLRATGAEVVRLPDHRIDDGVRKLLRNLEVPFQARLATPSTEIDRRRRDFERDPRTRLRRWARSRRDRFLQLRPGAEDQALAQLEAALPVQTNIAEYEAFLRDHRIDVLVSITPYVVQEVLPLRAARRLGIPVMTSVLSFDNLTTRPPLPIVFDRYLVWNRFNADEVRRGYPEVRADQIAIVGPAQFDFYGDPSWVVDRGGWCELLGLPPDVPTVLFGAGPPSVTPHEPQYLDHLLAALDAGRLPADLHIVLRRHPLDVRERWARFLDHPAVHFDDPWPEADQARPGHADMGDAQITSLSSTLAHTDVHVNTSSTLTLDGAFFGKPQIGPAYDDEGGRRGRRRAMDLYRREHFVPIVASGGLELSRSRTELEDQVRSALADPDRLAPQRQKMLDDMCAGTDFHATERVAAEILAFVASPPA